MVDSEPIDSPTVTADVLVADLRRLGLTRGATVLVHSSLSRLGHVVAARSRYRRAAERRPGGTVLFPTLTGTERDGRSPAANRRRASPCWTGRIPESARHRRRPCGACTQRLGRAIGAGAARYAVAMSRDINLRRAQPYHRLIEEEGSILLLGDVTQESNTRFTAWRSWRRSLPPQRTHRGVVVDAEGREHVVRNLLTWGDGSATSRGEGRARGGAIRFARRRRPRA